MEFVVDSMTDVSLNFGPAEYNLKYSKEEYKAYTCILYGENKISILDTSSKILLNEKSKYGVDHIKVHYGATSICNSLYKKYGFKNNCCKASYPVPSCQTYVKLFANC